MRRGGGVKEGDKEDGRSQEEEESMPFGREAFEKGAERGGRGSLTGKHDHGLLPSRLWHGAQEAAPPAAVEGVVHCIPW